MGFEGAKPFCESLSTFFSEESRGPSRPERQVKSSLRGKSEAGKGERQERKAVHTRRTAGKAQKRQSNTQAGKQRHRMRAHLRETSRTAAGRRHLPAPGAASPTGQTVAAKAPHTLRLQKNSQGSRMDEKAGLKGHNSGRPCKDDQPATWRGTPGAEKPLRTGKTRVRSFACPEGLCETGPPKNRFAVFGWHDFFSFALLFASHCVQRRAQCRTKGGAAPFYPLQAF